MDNTKMEVVGKLAIFRPSIPLRTNTERSRMCSGHLEQNRKVTKKGDFLLNIVEQRARAQGLCSLVSMTKMF